MYHYPHHIGDFDRATRHLTRIERSIYRDLLDVYYDTEERLTLDQPALCRKIIARAPEEAEAVKAILAEFFHETPTGWYHDRCEEEIDTYRKSTSQKSVAGKASAAARAARREQAINGKATDVPTTVPTAVERLYDGTPTNLEPRTDNLEPEPEPEKQAPPKKRARAKSDDATGTRLPEDWKPTPAEVEYCKTQRPDLLPSLVATNFYEYWRAKPGKDGRKTDWTLTWQSWVRKEKTENAPRPRTAGNVAQFPGKSVADQNAANTEEARRLLFGDKPKGDDLGALEHA